MGVRQSTTESNAESPGRTHLTTVVLEESGDGRWRATQTGVDVVGYGETAAAAATAYCATIDGESDEH